MTHRKRLRMHGPCVTLAAALIAAGAFAPPAQADEVTATVYNATADGPGAELGTVTFRDSEYGLIVQPDLRGLTPGLHGTHIHQNPDCGPSEKDGEVTPAGAAGGHLDPAGTGTHAGPYGDGHLGDLPNLYVEADGSAAVPVLAPRVTVADIRNRAVMIHGEADGYAQTAHEGHNGHGMGGPRAYCGVIE